MPQRHLLDVLQDSFMFDYQGDIDAKYLHDVCDHAANFDYTGRRQELPGSSSGSRSGSFTSAVSSAATSEFDVHVASASNPIPINVVGKHLHIPANVTLRAERRTRRAYSCPQPVAHERPHQRSHHPRDSPLISEYDPLPGDVGLNRQLERSVSHLSVASFAVRGTTKREKLILLSLAIVDFLSNMCLSVLAPFFPKEARYRNINDTLSGWIFGVFALVQFLASPVFGKLLSKVGSRFLFISGVFLGGGGTVLFGALAYFPLENETLFLVFCFLLRVVIGLGCTASNTASFAIMADTFPDNVGSVFGILETFTGLGLMVGPALGGVLYQAGGFFLPFSVLGGIMLFGVPLCSVILPKENEFEEMVSQGNARGSYRDLLRMPIVLAVCASIICAALCWSLLDPVLEPHFKVFNLSTAVIGLIFLLSSAFYAVSAPLWGWITDKVRDSCILLSFGFFLSAIAFLFLGPSELLGFDADYNELWLNLVSLIVLGLSVSLASVPTFEKILDVAEQEGIEDGLMLYGTVAGIWGSSNALGEFIGPSIGGTLVSTLGFGWTMTICSGICLFMSFVNFLCWCYNSSCSCRKKNDNTSDDSTQDFDENTPLLNPLSSQEPARRAHRDVRAEVFITSSYSDDDSNVFESYDSNFRTTNHDKFPNTEDFNDNSEFDSQNIDDIQVLPSRTRYPDYNSC